MASDDYVGHLSTVSAYLGLSGPVQDEVFAGVLSVLPPHVDVVADITAHLARLAVTAAARSG